MVNSSQYPDFIGIGAQKAATTWIYAILHTQNDVWLPPVKELHYWSDADWVRKPGILDRLRSMHSSDVRWRRYFIPCFKSSIRYADIDLLKWNIRFFFGERNDQWYQSLFPPKSNTRIVRGEITPAYALISEQEIERIRDLNNQLKLIYILRDPIDRTWSQARMFFRSQNKNIKDMKLGVIQDFLGRRDVIERGLYSKTLKKWEQFIYAENIFIESMDNISNSPEEVVARLFDFLGIERSSSEKLSSLLNKKIFQGENSEIPKEIERYLASCYLDDLQELADTGRVDCESWLERAELAIR